jgi:alpha-D-ribose 1-methylphosphonate 5-triphosphate synthase subunit PhnI
VNPYLQALAAEARGDLANARRPVDQAAERVTWADRKVLVSASISSSALHAIALGHAGRTAEAVIASNAVLAAERRLASLNRTDRLQPYELALALYADALAEPANATGNLVEAAKVMDSLRP